MATNQNKISISSSGKPIVQTDDFAVTHNHITFLFGESGIGKSLLCKSIFGILNPDELTVNLAGKDYQLYCNNPLSKELRINGFFVFQEPSSHLNPLLTLKEQLTEGSCALADPHDKNLSFLMNVSSEEELDHLTSVYPKPYRPSGGEKQRMLLAMSFKKIDLYIEKAKPGAHALFVFDEPTGSLDNTYRNLFLKLLFKKYAERQFTAVVITHDYSIISEITKTYPTFSAQVEYKELSRTTETNVVLNDFSARDYSSWLTLVKPASHQQKPIKQVLRFDSQFSIFNRNLCIFSDKNRTKQTSLTINAGDLVYVKAASGVGKTTLAKIILGLYKADSFSMELCGMGMSPETSEALWQKHIWGKRASMVFQHADEALNLESKVKDIFAGLSIKNPEVLNKLMDNLFGTHNLETFKNRTIKYLSGGQKQRLNLLRTIALAPELLILDEPLNGLDFVGVQKILALMDDCCKNGIAILLISHNEEIFDAIVEEGNIYYLGEINKN